MVILFIYFIFIIILFYHKYYFLRIEKSNSVDTVYRLQHSTNIKQNKTKSITATDTTNDQWVQFCDNLHKQAILVWLPVTFW